MCDDQQLLQTWERCYHARPMTRALWLASLVRTEVSADELLRLPLGERDRALLALRERLFGSRLQSVVDCIFCGERLELNVALDQLLVRTEPAASAESTMNLAGLRITYRAPNSMDLASIAGATPAQREARLLEICASAVDDSGRAVSTAELSDELRAAVAEQIADCDPLANIQFHLSCAACQQSFLAPFDILAFLWAELDGFCQRLLRDIHSLAGAYGWSEGEILAMSSWRRQVYLNMVRQ
jgi:hypothetical protein